MDKNILEITEKITDKQTLKNLKKELIQPEANINNIIEKYTNEYYNIDDNYETKTYTINLGYNRTLKNFQKNMKKMMPCSKPKNYRQTNIRAKGPWKNIYEIAFGVTETTITTKTPIKEKTKQIKIKEAI